MFGILSARHRVVNLFLAILFVGMASTSAFSQEEENEGPLFFRQHQAGVRIGVWGSLGDIPVTDTVINTTQIFSDIGDASVYVEGYFGYRFSSIFMGEFSVGIVSRGDVSRQNADTTLSQSSDIGTMMVYPILAKLKIYPFRQLFGKFHPYVFGGGGAYHARIDIQFVGSSQFGVPSEESETAFSYAFGGGFDWPIAEKVGLELHAQYLPIDFNDALIGVNDWSSLTITVGIKYLFEPKKNNRNR